MTSKSVFKLVIAGSRGFSNYELLRQKCDLVLARKVADPNLTIQIVSGGANGADKLGEKYAKERGFEVTIFRADWSKGKMAGYTRNVAMAEYADAVIAFDLGTKGTGHMLTSSPP